MSQELREHLKALRALMTETPEEAARALDYPTPWEAGVTHPYQPVHFLCRDDEVAEMTAGTGATIIADSRQQQVTAIAGKIALAAYDLHLHSAPLGLWFGFQRWDPGEWWTREPYDIRGFTDYLWNGPLVLNREASLAALDGAPPGDFIAGAPQPGQRNVSLAQILHPQPLLGPNEWFRIMVFKLAQLAKEVVIHGLGK